MNIPVAYNVNAARKRPVKKACELCFTYDHVVYLSRGVLSMWGLGKNFFLAAPLSFWLA